MTARDMARPTGSPFEQTELPRLRALMRQRPLATLVWAGSEGLVAQHLPFELDDSSGPLGVLRGHVARSNPLWRHAAGTQVLLVFHGPQAYISPSWYPGKAEHHRVVPTWNYAVVHAHGALRVHDDTVWLRALLRRQTASLEAHRAQAWRLEDAPTPYIEGALSAIVGIEVDIHRLHGTWKLSQNRSARDRAGVAAGLRAEGEASAHEMAEWVAQQQA